MSDKAAMPEGSQPSANRGPAPEFPVDSQTLIPDLLTAAPAARRVLDRYGLRGCGGPLGPHETLEFFARAHDVPLEQLLAEIRAELQRGEHAADIAPPPAEAGIADTVYRPFFRAGIAVVLTLGATWGAYLLTRIGLLGSFTAVNIHHVNAHGHAQIFGWVGLFVMGFAYQAFPRFKHTDLAHPRLAWLTLWLMLAGVVLRAVAEPAGVAEPALWNVVHLGSALEIVAVVTFICIIAKTLYRSPKPLVVYDGYILASLFWFLVQTVYTALLFAAFARAATQEQLLALVANWQAPLREIQIHGFAMLMILGVSQRIFPNFYGLPAPSPTKSRVALVLLNLAIAGEAIGLLLMRAVSRSWVGLWYASILLLAGCVVVLLFDWRVFGRAEERDRSLKFLRTAYGWLLVSLAMAVLIPVYQFGILRVFAPASEAAQIGFSHAYYGALRHAITVGFISLMIVGVAAKVVPTLVGADPARLPALWTPFFLINTGCALRVVGQVLTDLRPAIFPFVPVSGALEVTGLAIWGFHLLSMMTVRGARRWRELAETARPALRPGEPIRGDHRVGDVLAVYPSLLEVFLRHGFEPLRNPLLRKTVARHITITSACRKQGLDEKVFLDKLNQAAGTTVAPPSLVQLRKFEA